MIEGIQVSNISSCDGSSLPFADNMSFTASIVRLSVLIRLIQQNQIDPTKRHSTLKTLVLKATHFKVKMFRLRNEMRYSITVELSLGTLGSKT